jgi:putative ABC transport system permease protein
MSVFRRLLFRLANLLRPEAAERSLEREVASHLALLEERFRAQGLTPDEARIAARRAFGGVEQAKELQRDARSFAWLEDTRRDLLYAIRTLSATPGFTFVAVLTLALGIGAVTIIYSIINNVLFDPLPYPDSDRLVNVFVVDQETGRIALGAFRADEFLDYQQGSQVFEDVVGTLGTGMMLTAREGAESLRGVWVTPNFFEFMGLPALIGRVAGPEDGRPDSPPVAVLRHRAWVAYFGADPGVVGTTIVLNGEPHTVIGVMPPRFTWHGADVWIPKAIGRGLPDDRTTMRNFQARLKPGVRLREAETQLNVLASRRAAEFPAEYPKTFRMQVVNVIEFTVGQFSTVLYITLAAVGLLLLISCCNVANMLLARATVREREMTVRAALGAGRTRIVRQLLVESLLLGLAGAVAGCLFAYVGLDALIAVLPVAPLPGEVEIAIDGAALAVSLGAAVFSALLFGIAPALYSARRDLVDGLKGSGKGLAGGRGRLRNALVAAEIALSLVLLLGAGLLMRTFVSLVRVDLGFDPRSILFVPVAFPPDLYATPADKHQFYERAMQRIAALPGVEAVSASTGIPPGGGPETQIDISGVAAGNSSPATVQSCTEGYFQTLGIRLLRGRGLPALAAGELPRTAVVNQTFVSSYLKDADPIGQHLRIRSPGLASESFEVVGVVEDVRNRGVRQATVPHVYLPGATGGRGNPVILARTRTDPLPLLNALRREIARIDSRVALVQPRTIQDILERGTYAQPRFSLIVFGIFAAIGTLLVAVGVFSVMAYTVSRQTREIAVRMALGAGRGQVLRVVLGLGARLLAAGAAIGLVASFATNRLIGNQLWNTSPYDPLTFLAATSVIAVVALAACYIPARRAMAIDPMAALRQE